MKTITLHKVSFLTIQRLMLICLVMIGGCGAEEDEYEEALQVASKTVEYTESGVKFEVERASQNLKDGIPERYTIRLTNETPNPIDTTDYTIKIGAYTNTEPQKMRQDIAFTYTYGGKAAQRVELGKKISLKKEMNIDQLHPQKTVTIHLNTKDHTKHDLPEGAVEVVLYPPGQQPIVIAKPWKCDEPLPYNEQVYATWEDSKFCYKKGALSPDRLKLIFKVHNDSPELRHLENFKIRARAIIAGKVRKKMVFEFTRSSWLSGDSAWAFCCLEEKHVLKPFSTLEVPVYIAIKEIARKPIQRNQDAQPGKEDIDIYVEYTYRKFDNTLKSSEGEGLNVGSGNNIKELLQKIQHRKLQLCKMLKKIDMDGGMKKEFNKRAGRDRGKSFKNQ